MHASRSRHRLRPALRKRTTAIFLACFPPRRRPLLHLCPVLLVLLLWLSLTLRLATPSPRPTTPLSSSQLQIQPSPLSTTTTTAAVPLAPRAARSRRVLSARTAPFHRVSYAVHAIVLCPHLTCCTSSLRPVITALVAQSLAPAHLTILHWCPGTKATAELRHTARSALGGPSSLNRAPTFVDHACASSDVRCALRALPVLAHAAAVPFTLLLTPRHVLEPPAVEKMWLSLRMRPTVPAVRAWSYDVESLHRERARGEALAVRRVLPLQESPVLPLPLLYNASAFLTAFRAAPLAADEWAPLVTVLAAARVVREALYTQLDIPTAAPALTTQPALSLAALSKEMLPAHLFSELAAQRWAARKDEDEMYSSRPTRASDLDVARVAFPPLAREMGETRAFLVLPWMQMGGSEKCMLDIAARMVDTGWTVTFVLTMPFWQEDAIGEIGLLHEWLDKALALSADTFDLLALANHDKAVRLFRHLIESREPDFVLTSNSRWMYGNSHLLKHIAPKTVVADFNHMIHMNWDGGGLPRFGANSSAHFDLHLTASRNVADSMKRWIDEDIMTARPEKVQSCHIGTDPVMLHIGDAKKAAKDRMRRELNITEDKIVVLFAGRFVVDKGLDVVADLVNRVAESASFAQRITFLFVGSGVEEYRLKALRPTPIQPNMSQVVIKPRARGLLELRDYYAASDVLLLPSVNEGIALVIYEAMAAGVLIIATDVGGQKEVVRNDTGILLPNLMSISGMSKVILEKLREVVEDLHGFQQLAENGRDLVRTKYTTEIFCACVMENLLRARSWREDEEEVVDEDDDDNQFDDEVSALDGAAGGDRDDDTDGADNDDDDGDDVDVDRDDNDGNGHVDDDEKDIYARDSFSDKMRRTLADGVAIERHHGQWNRNIAIRAIENAVTIGIKTFVCDASIVEQVHGLIRSIRVHYPTVRVMLGNDGPLKLGSEKFVTEDAYTEEVILPEDGGISLGRNYLVNLTTTRYFLLLDDDHVFDDTTNLTVLVNGIRQESFDLVGLRIRNLPGIDELERTGIVIPRYVGLIRSLENRELTVCVWNENNGPSIFGITHPIPVDILHNAFIGLTDVLREFPWRNELKVNEHMTFFLDAKKAGLRVGYLPSVFVHHRSRDYSDCYYKVRFREEEYRFLLPYKDEFNWDLKCQATFLERVRTHILRYELDL